MANVIGEAVYKVRADTSGFQREAEGGVGRSMLGLATKLGAGFAAFKVFDFAKDSIIGFNSTLQQSKAAFTTLLGGARPATKAISELQTFAAKTPFAFEELLKPAQQLLGTGTKLGDLVPVMTRLGDAVSSTGGTSADLDQLTLAYTQMSTSGRANLQDLMQINNAVPGTLARMAEAGGMSIGKFRDEVSKGSVSSAEAVKLFTKATEGVGGAMEKQSHTFAGAMSNIQDSLQQTLARVGKPIFDAVASAAGGLASELAKLGEVFDSVLEHTGSTRDALSAVAQVILADLGVSLSSVQTTMTIAGTAFDTFIAAVSGLFEIINGNRDVMVALLIGFTAYTVLMPIATAVTTAYATVMGVVRIATAAAAAQQSVLNALFLANPIGIIVIAIAALVAGLFILYQRNETVRTAIQATWSWIQENIPPIIHAVIGAIQQVIGAIQNFITQNQQFRAVVQAVWNFISTYIRGQLQVIKGVINVVMGLIHGDWDRVWQGIKQILTGALQAMTAALRAFAPLLGSAAKAIGVAVLEGIVGFIKQLPGRLASLKTNVDNAINRAVTSAFTAARGLGASIIQGIISGVASLAGALKDAVIGVAGDALDAGKSALGIGSPSKLFAKEMGMPIAQGIAEGITAGLPLVAGALSGIGGTASGTVSGGTTTNNTRTLNVGQVVLPTVTTGGDLVRQLDALVARPG